MPLPASLALTSIATSSQILSADHRNNYLAIQTAVNALIAASPGYEYAYNEFTGNVSVTATTEATANTVVSASAVTFDGATPVVVEFYAMAVRPPSVAPASVLIWLYQDGASIGEMAQVTTPAASTLDIPVRAARRLTPASGSRTYSIRASSPAGTGTVFAGAGGAGVVVPGFVRITKV